MPRLPAHPVPRLQCAHFAGCHRLPTQPSRVIDQRQSRAYIGQFTPDGNLFIGACAAWGAWRAAGGCRTPARAEKAQPHPSYSQHTSAALHDAAHNALHRCAAAAAFQHERKKP